MFGIIFIMQIRIVFIIFNFWLQNAYLFNFSVFYLDFKLWHKGIKNKT